MESIERDLTTYGGLVAAARARAEGIRKLFHDKAHKQALVGCSPEVPAHLYLLTDAGSLHTEHGEPVIAHGGSGVRQEDHARVLHEAVGPDAGVGLADRLELHEVESLIVARADVVTDADVGPYRSRSARSACPRSILRGSPADRRLLREEGHRR